MLRYYVPEIAKIFRVEPMPRNRVQHQKGLSDDAFERLYPDEEACRKAWFAWRWPEGFKCPRCVNGGVKAGHWGGVKVGHLRHCSAVGKGTRSPCLYRPGERIRDGGFRRYGDHKGGGT